MKQNILFTGIITLAFVTTGVSQLTAQVDTSVEKMEFFNLSNSTMIGKRPPLPGVKGTPYLSEEWVSGEVLTKDGQLVDNLEILLNTHDNEVEIQKGGRHLRLPSYTLESIRTSEGKEYVAIENKFPTLYVEGFMEVLAQYDQATIYKRYYCYKKDPTYVEGVGVGSRDFELIHKEEVYIANDQGVARLYNNHRKNVQALQELGIGYEKSKKVKLKTIESAQDYVAKI